MPHTGRASASMRKGASLPVRPPAWRVAGGLVWLVIAPFASLEIQLGADSAVQPLADVTPLLPRVGRPARTHRHQLGQRSAGVCAEAVFGELRKFAPWYIWGTAASPCKSWTTCGPRTPHPAHPSLRCLRRASRRLLAPVLNCLGHHRAPFVQVGESKKKNFQFSVTGNSGRYPLKVRQR